VLESRRKRPGATPLRNKGTVLFVDRVGIWSLWKILLHRRRIGWIYYFESGLENILHVCKRARILQADVSQVHQHVGEPRDGDGAATYVKWWDDGLATCSRILQEELATAPLLKAVGAFWQRENILVHFERMIERSLCQERFRIGLVAHMKTRHELDAADCVLLVRKSPWVHHLVPQARREGIRLQIYGLTIDFIKTAATSGRWAGRLARGLPGLLKVVAGLLRGISTRAVRGPSSPETDTSVPAPKLAIRYYYRSLSFDPTVRSEFFWLTGSGIPLSQVLLYDVVRDKPLDPDVQKKLDREGIGLIGNGPGIAAWVPTYRYYQEMIVSGFRVLWGAILGIFKGRRSSLVYVQGLLRLSREYAYWYDFYLVNEIVLNISTFANVSVAQSLALNKVGAIGAAYQYSASSLVFPSSYYRGGEDIAFVFAPAFTKRQGWGQSLTGRFVEAGFIYDGAICSVRDTETPLATRKELQQRGAEFVICFFDENSVDRWDVSASNSDAASEYVFLLEWLLDDPTLGLIVKPKKAADLFLRLDSISSLIDAARNTGRCKFLLASDTIVGNVYPAEAALAADVCIGRLGADTAALEARLAGVRALLVDGLALRHSHPLYERGVGSAVFDDWEAVRSAVTDYRMAPDEHSNLGDWPWLDELDPFQDGLASQRMGRYINCAYQALASGASREQALDLAESKFKGEWGEHHVHVR
jgi:hypothetical protein